MGMVGTEPGADIKTSGSATQREFDLTESQFRFFADIAYSRTGIVLAEHKRDMVYGRLVRRLRALKLSGFKEYCALLESDKAGDEIGHLINAITTNLTGFFREAHHFEHLHQTVLAPIASKPRRLRLWSSACSSGMEPYSMAMVLRRAIPNIDQWDARILATDIDTAMLERGRNGTYEQGDVEKVPDGYACWDKGAGSDVHMRDELKRLIAFKQLNLLEAWPMKGLFDVIFCRNVVIYFDKPTKERLFDRMADIMAPEGWLYIGHSENLHNVTDRFEPMGRTIYRKVK